MELWHNPRCSKSRQAKALLEARGVDHRTRLYLDDPPTPAELDRVLAALGLEPWDFARKKEDAFAELGLCDWPQDRQRWLAALAAHPKLIERPVLITADGRAAIGRPPEQLLGLLPP